VGAAGGTAGESLPQGFGERAWADGGVGLKVTHRLGGLREASTALMSAMPSAGIRAQVGSGVIEVSVDVDAVAELDSLRLSISSLDGQVVVASAPDGVKRDLDVWGPVRGLAVMERIKAQFDPGGRMCPGRFVVAS
jgi:glycolate oxidase FAD binding subunit